MLTYTTQKALQLFYIPHCGRSLITTELIIFFAFSLAIIIFLNRLPVLLYKTYTARTVFRTVKLPQFQVCQPYNVTVASLVAGFKAAIIIVIKCTHIVYRYISLYGNTYPIWERAAWPFPSCEFCTATRRQHDGTRICLSYRSYMSQTLSCN